MTGDFNISRAFDHDGGMLGEALRRRLSVPASEVQDSGFRGKALEQRRLVPPA